MHVIELHRQFALTNVFGWMSKTLVMYVVVFLNEMQSGNPARVHEHRGCHAKLTHML